MKRKLATRELVTVQAGYGPLEGTYHRPPAHAYAGTANLVGLLFVNAFSTPRASYGDTAVCWADELAAAGYPCFRFDLPGLGDSCGESPAPLLPFINGGGHSRPASSLLEELVKRYRLAGLVLVGHCAGAITALYAAAETRHCRGLVLLDPYFYQIGVLKPEVRLKLVDWAARSRIGRVVRAGYHTLRALERRARRHPLPANANQRLLARWKQVSTGGLPILILKSPGLEAPGTTLRAGQFPYLRHILALAGRGSRVDVHWILETDHSFANRAGRTAVCAYIKEWLGSEIPHVKREESFVSTGWDSFEAAHTQPASSSAAVQTPREPAGSRG